MISTSSIFVIFLYLFGFSSENHLNHGLKSSNPCLAVIACPAVDGSDSVYAQLPDPTKFCQCSNGVPYVHQCPASLHFNPKINVCDWPSQTIEPESPNPGSPCSSTTTTNGGGCNFTPTTTTTTASTTTTSTPQSGGGCSTTTAASEGCTPTTTTSASPSLINDCIVSGVICPAVDGPDSVYFPLPDCTKFCQCSNGFPYQHNCPTGLHFNPTLNVCDWPSSAGCTGGSSTSTSPAISTEDTTPTTTTTEPCDSDNVCIQNNVVCPAVDGPDSVYAPLPNCTQFCQCSNGVPYVHNCPDGLHFNPILNVCDWPQNAGCISSPSTSVTATPTTTTTEPCDSDNVCIHNNVVCPAVDGPDSVYAPLPNCTQFCQCSNGVPYVHNCPDGLHFNPILNVCDWPQNAGCISSPSTSVATTPTTTTTEPCDSDNVCIQNNVVCPAVDGPDSVYAPLPNCTQFCQCSNGVPYVQNCPDGLYFNPILNVCDWPQNAGCISSPSTSVTATPTTTTTEPCDSDNVCIHNNVVCPAVDGPDSVYAPLPNCTQFCQCSNGVPYVHNCPDGLHFNPILNVCDWPQNAGCISSPSTSVATTPTTTTTEPCDSDNVCIQNNVVCPAVDGPDSVYAPLPNCTQFCQCSNGVPYVHNCPDGLHFNPILNVCDWPQNAGCISSPSTSVTTTPTTTTTAPCDSDNVCIQNNVVCPAVDGPDSVYAPLPNCTQFCQCSNGVPYVHNCLDGLHFNPILNVCDWPQNAGCISSPSTSVATTPTTTTTEPCDSDNVCIQNNVVCPAVDGQDSVYAPLPNCTQFCQCSNGVPYVHNCPDGLHFNPILNVCDWPQNAGCISSPSTSVTATPTTTTTEPCDSDNVCIQNNVVCPAVDGPDSVYAPLPNCTQFCQCSNGVPYVHNCPDGLHFNPILNVCDWPQNAGCISSPSTSVATTPTTTTTEPCDSDNVCIQNNVVCPAVDGQDSVYAPLPNCTQFCQCSNGVPYVHNCPQGLHFNPVLNVCDWPQNAGCSGNSSTAAPSSPSSSGCSSTTTANGGCNTTPSPTTPTSTASVSNDCIDAGVSCPSIDGPDSVYAPLPDCTKFCQCSNGLPYVHNCPQGLHFNPVLNVCDWPQNAGCSGNSSTAATLSPSSGGCSSTTTANGGCNTTPSPTTPTPTASVSNDCIDASVSCPSIDGPDSVYAPLPDCTKFCQCSNGLPYVHNCPQGLHFNPVLNVCDWPQNAGCSGNSSTAATSSPSSGGCSSTTTANGGCNTTPSPTTAKPSSPSGGGCSLTTTSSGGCNTNPSSTTTTPSTTSVTNDCFDAGVSCPPIDGPDSVYAPLPDCTKFCQCSNGVPYVHNCPQGLHFNPVLNVCDWPQNAGCSGISN